MEPFRTKGLFATKNPAFGNVTDDGPAAKYSREVYLEALRSDAPVNWTSSHLRENQSDYGPIYIALRVLMAQAASAVCKAYKWHPDAKMGGDQEAKQYLPRQDPISRLMNMPNRWDSGRTMRARAVMQRALTGMWLGWRVDEGVPWTNENDTPKEIWTVPTGTYTAVPPSSMSPNGAYRVMPFWPGPYATLPGTWQSGGVVVPAENMVVSSHPHPLTYKEGLSPLAACAEELDTINAIGRARKSIMKRVPVPGGTVEMDSQALWPDKAQLNRINAQIYNMIGGADKAGKPAILGPGMKWVQSKIQGYELPWGDSWDQLLRFVFAVFGVTQSMVGMNESSSYAALYAALKQFDLFTMIPELDDLADAFNMQVIWPFFGEEYGIEFETKKVSDEDLLEKQLSNDLAAGIRTVNEWRQLRNLIKIDGAEGEKFVKAGDDKDVKTKEQQAAEQQASQQGADGDKPVNPAEKTRPKNNSGAGSLPPRLQTMTSSNGKH